MDKGWCRGVDTIGRLKSGVTYVMYVVYTTMVYVVCMSCVHLFFFKKKLTFYKRRYFLPW
jgi:hypothetical protein